MPDKNVHKIQHFKKVTANMIGEFAQFLGQSCTGFCAKACSTEVQEDSINENYFRDIE